MTAKETSILIRENPTPKPPFHHRYHVDWLRRAGDYPLEIITASKTPHKIVGK
jgi:hypothetical protein